MGFLSSVLAALTKRGLFISIPLPFSWTGDNELDLMDITVNRMTFTENSTIGELWMDGKFFCYTLEDTCRNHKVDGKTAIPAGRYQLTIDYSEKFSRDMPHLLEVPNFEGVRIHWGNKPEDTEGCILVGTGKTTDFITGSKLAFDQLYPALENKLAKGPLFVSILGGVHDA